MESIRPVHPPPPPRIPGRDHRPAGQSCRDRLLPLLLCTALGLFFAPVVQRTHALSLPADTGALLRSSSSPGFYSGSLPPGSYYFDLRGASGGSTEYVAVLLFIVPLVLGF